MVSCCSILNKTKFWFTIHDYNDKQWWVKFSTSHSNSPSIQKTAPPAPESQSRGNEVTPIAAYCWLGASSFPGEQRNKYFIEHTTYHSIISHLVFLFRWRVVAQCKCSHERCYWLGTPLSQYTMQSSHTIRTYFCYNTCQKISHLLDCSLCVKCFFQGRANMGTLIIVPKNNFKCSATEGWKSTNSTSTTQFDPLTHNLHFLLGLAFSSNIIHGSTTQPQHNK